MRLKRLLAALCVLFMLMGTLVGAVLYKLYQLRMKDRN